MGVFQSCSIAGVLDDGKLHTKAESQERNPVLSCIPDSSDLAVDSPIAEAAGNEDAGYVSQKFRNIFSGNLFGVYPFDIDDGMVVDAAMF